MSHSHVMMININKLNRFADIAAPFLVNKMTKIYLIRHGETDANLVGKFEGQGGNSPLNDNGLLQASCLAKRFEKEEISAIYTSDLRRAVQTAEAVAKIQKSDMIIKMELREIDIGIWEGLTQDEISTNDPDLYLQWSTDYTSVLVPESESFHDLAERSIRAFNELASLHRGNTIAIVSHGGPIKSILGFLTGMEPKDFMGIDMYNTGVNHIDLLSKSHQVRYMNCIAHLNSEPLQI